MAEQQIIKFKYNYHFSINFCYPCNIDPEEAEGNKEVASKLYEEMEEWVLDVIKHGSYCLDWYDVEEREDLETCL